MKTINVDGLPDPVIRSLEAVVHTLRVEIRGTEKARRRVKLPVWPGKVIGSLTREEIYKDVG